MVARSLRKELQAGPAAGLDAFLAVQLATLIVAAVEGTVAMCRAKRSTEPLDRSAEQLQRLIRAAV